MSARYFEFLTDEQWQLLEPLFPAPIKRGRGKPHAPWRVVVDSILWVLLTGLKWDALPKHPLFSTKSVAHRWFVLWEKSGFLREVLATHQGLNEGAVKLPRRRNRLPAAKKDELLETLAAV